MGLRDAQSPSAKAVLPPAARGGVCLRSIWHSGEIGKTTTRTNARQERDGVYRHFRG